MKIQILTLIAGASLAAFVAPSAVMAQSADSAVNLQNSDSPNSSDPFSQGVEQNPFNMFQLIHNAKFGSLNPEFAKEQSQQLDDAASEFRKKQQQLIQRNQQSGTTQGSQVIVIPSK
jgi:hypothetical protein